MKKTLLVLALVMVSATVAKAQVPDLNSLIPRGSGTVTSRIIQIVALLTVLSVAPGLLVMVTSFTRFAVALSFLRSGLGLQSTPANLILISLSLFMTFYVMAPTFERAWDDGVKPLMNNSMPEEEAFWKITEPFREFMMSHVRDKDLKLFEDLARGNFKTKDQAKGEIRVLIPAFMISELRRGFEIGFLIALGGSRPPACTLSWPTKVRSGGCGNHLPLPSLFAPTQQMISSRPRPPAIWLHPRFLD
jgi:flagellar biosynthesis protein FliP